MDQIDHLPTFIFITLQVLLCNGFLVSNNIPFLIQDFTCGKLVPLGSNSVWHNQVVLAQFSPKSKYFWIMILIPGTFELTFDYQVVQRLTSTLLRKIRQDICQSYLPLPGWGSAWTKPVWNICSENAVNIFLSMSANENPAFDNASFSLIFIPSINSVVNTLWNKSYKTICLAYEFLWIKLKMLTLNLSKACTL